MRKTERIYASGPLVGDSMETALASVREAMLRLGQEGERAGREVLWDTLDFEVEMNETDERSLTGMEHVSTHSSIHASALAVKRG